MRLFIAIPLPRHVKEKLLERQAVEGIRWQQQDQMHLTLKFLGQADIDRLGEIKESLKNIKRPEFSLVVNGFGYFPKGKQPKVLWADIESNSALENLHQEIEETCSKVGFERERRKFKPHITVGRITQASKQAVELFIKKHEHFHISGIPVEEFALYESKLYPKGAKHLRLATFQLGNN